VWCTPHRSSFSKLHFEKQKNEKGESKGGKKKGPSRVPSHAHKWRKRKYFFLLRARSFTSEFGARWRGREKHENEN
jgi:hypothetical protein